MNLFNDNYNAYLSVAHSSTLLRNFLGVMRIFLRQLVNMMTLQASFKILFVKIPARVEIGCFKQSSVLCKSIEVSSVTWRHAVKN